LKRAFLLPLGLSLAGCISYCKMEPVLVEAERGDPVAIAETGELGRPRVPSSALPQPILRAGFEALAPSLSSSVAARRINGVEALRHLSERAPDIFRNHFATIFDAALADPESEVRWRAAWALGRLGTTSPGLRAAASDPDDEVAETACLALGQAHDADAAPVLVLALDRGGPVERAAIGGLTRLYGRELDGKAAWKRWVAERLAARSLASVATPDTAAVSS
jgi:hypothetical protein